MGHTLQICNGNHGNVKNLNFVWNVVFFTTMKHNMYNKLCSYFISGFGAGIIFTQHSISFFFVTITFN